MCEGMAVTANGNGISKRPASNKEAAARGPGATDGGKGGGPDSSPVSSHWTLLVVFLSLLVDLLGFTVILPLIPSMLEYYNKNDQVVCLFSLVSVLVLTSLLLPLPPSSLPLFFSFPLSFLLPTPSFLSPSFFSSFFHSSLPPPPPHVGKPLLLLD